LHVYGVAGKRSVNAGYARLGDFASSLVPRIVRVGRRFTVHIGNQESTSGRKAALEFIELGFAHDVPNCSLKAITQFIARWSPHAIAHLSVLAQQFQQFIEAQCQPSKALSRFGSKAL
jgi:hypothetical protein